MVVSVYFRWRSGSAILELQLVRGLYVGDMFAEHRGDRAASARYGSKRVASASLVHSDYRLDIADYLVR